MLESTDAGRGRYLLLERMAPRLISSPKRPRRELKTKDLQPLCEAFRLFGEEHLQRRVTSGDLQLHSGCAGD